MSRPTTTRILLAPLVALLIALAFVVVVSVQSRTGATPAGFCHRHPNAPRCHTSPPPSSSATSPTSPTSATTATSPTSATTATSPTSPTSATSAPGTYSCSAQIGGNCGPYAYGLIPMSNGFNTYVANQGIDVHGTATVHANSPGDWNVVANLSDCGGCVQIYPDAQQLTNDWNGSGWGNCGSTCADTPWRSLSTLKIAYNETSPQTGASYQFSPDVWGPGPWDIMFWVDTHGRCNEGAFGPTLLGHLTIDGQNWTAHQYGTEIILVLDGAGGSGTCAQQSSGTINVKAGLDWLWNNGFIHGTTMSQLNTGWEITQASNATFTVHNYSITAQ